MKSNYFLRAMRALVFWVGLLGATQVQADVIALQSGAEPDTWNLVRFDSYYLYSQPLPGFVQTPGGLRHERAIDSWQRRLFLLRTDWNVLEVDLASGTQTRSWQVPMNGMTRFVFFKAQNSLVGIADDGNGGVPSLTKLDLGTGEFSTVSASLAIGGRLANEYAFDASVGLLYLARTDGWISVVDVSNGVVLRELPLPPGAIGSFHFDEVGNRLVGIRDGGHGADLALFAVDIESGELTQLDWWPQMGGRASQFSALDAYRNTLYISRDAGGIDLIEIPSGFASFDIHRPTQPYSHLAPLYSAPTAPYFQDVIGDSGGIVAYFDTSYGWNPPPTAFNVTCTSTNGGVAGSATGVASPLRVGGLTNGAAYKCNVTATNIYGTSPTSYPSMEVIPSATGIDGLCGSANGTPSTTFPVHGLCASGNPTEISQSESGFYWWCTGATGGSSAFCSAPRELPVGSTVRWSSRYVTVEEGTSSIQVHAIREHNLELPFSVRYETLSGSAMSGDDYTPVSGVLSFPAGSAWATASVHIVDDMDMEGQENLQVALSEIIDGTGTIDSPSRISVVIADNDHATVSMPNGQVSVVEGSPIQLTLTRSGNLNTAFSVPWFAGAQYGEARKLSVTSGTVDFPSGVSTVTLSIPTVGDSLTDRSAYASFSVGLGNASIPNVVTPYWGTSVKVYDDDYNVFSFQNRSVTVNEGATANLVVTRTGALTRPTSFTWRTIPGSASESDFVPASGTALFPAGQSSTTLSIRTVSDAIAEDMQFGEYFRVEVTPADDGSTHPDPVSASVYIRDDDGALVSFESGGSIAVTEGGTASFAIRRQGNQSLLISVPWRVEADSATLSTIVNRSGTVTIPAGVASATISIGTRQDSIPNEPRYFRLDLLPPTTPGAQLGTASSYGLISDDDGSIGFADTSTNVLESNSSVHIALHRTFGDGAVTTVTLSAKGGTAAAGTDFGTRGVASYSGTVTFHPGESYAYLSIPILNASTATGPREFVVSIDRVSNGTIDPQHKTFTVMILEDDKGVQLASTTARVAESAGSVVVTVNRVGPPDGDVSVNWTTANGSALAGTHFGAQGSTTQRSGTVQWASGDASPRTVAIPIFNDGASNSPRTFTLTLTSAVGVAIGANKAATITIDDDDNVVQFNSPTRSVVESVGNIVLTVTRAGGTANAASVGWSTGNGTAVAGTDFGTAGNAAGSNGVLTWSAGESAAKTITIPIINNTVLSGGTRTFTVTLGTPTGANIGANATTTVTIQDDEKGVVMAAATYQVQESAANVVVMVNRVGDSAAALSVPWATSNGTAAAGTRFGVRGNTAQRTGTLTWPVGDATAKSIAIPIVANVVSDGDAEFSVTLGAVPNGFIKGTPSSAVVTIRDDDVANDSIVEFSTPKTVVMEGSGASATLTLVRSVHPSCSGANCNLSRSVSVKYSTAPGTALAGSDFVGVANGTVEFAPGESSKSVSVGIANNNVAEEPEALSVRLSAPSPGLVLGARSETSIIIQDDDEQFPPAGNWPVGWVVPDNPNSNLDLGWHVTTEPGAADGFAALRSDTLFNGESASVETALRNHQAGTVAFKYRVSSELGYDWLRFYRCDANGDCTKLAEWSGRTNETNWAQANITVPQGLQRFRWAYEKDSAISVGHDAAWIDAVSLPPLVQ